MESVIGRVGVEIRVGKSYGLNSGCIMLGLELRLGKLRLGFGRVWIGVSIMVWEGLGLELGFWDESGLWL